MEIIIKIKPHTTLKRIDSFCRDIDKMIHENSDIIEKCTVSIGILKHMTIKELLEKKD